MADKHVKWGWPPNKISYLNSLMTGHRMSQALFNELWGRQQGCCAGCKQSFAYPFHNEEKYGLQPRVDRRDKEPVDATDIRGLLCGGCKTLLHELLKDVEKKQALIEYLRGKGDWP